MLSPVSFLEDGCREEKLIVHERVQSTHPWAEKQGDHWFSGVISLKKRGVIRERENWGFQTIRLCSRHLPGRDVLESREGRKTPSEHSVDSPLTTINTVCGRSREIANPKALRYLFSWSRLESSCSLEDKSGSRKQDKYLVGGKKMLYRK